MELVINRCYGGFGLSVEAQKMYAARKGKKLTFYHLNDGYHRVTANAARDHDFASTRNLGAHVDAIPDECCWFPVIDRDDPDLLRVVKKLTPQKASGLCAKLAIVEIPDGTDYTIEDYDGMEHVAERHRTWG
jgi:hypothetical protein